MLELQRLRSDHAETVLTFELANRAYFAISISDRGDDFYSQFTERHDVLLAEQEAGINAFCVLVDGGSVLGRFNLYDITDATAKLGYRVAEHVAGRGVATATVREMCRLAAAQYGLRALTAATSHDNVASQKVLTKAGFVPVGPADPTTLAASKARCTGGILPQSDVVPQPMRQRAAPWPEFSRGRLPPVVQWAVPAGRPD